MITPAPFRICISQKNLTFVVPNIMLDNHSSQIPHVAKVQ